MRCAIGTIPFLLTLGALPALTDTLPSSCGPVGAKGYTPPAVTIPTVDLHRGTVITVTSATMTINGDTSSVKALAANAGSDGISIQEAIMATNSDPGTWVIQFASALKGSIIVVDSGPVGGLSLSGGNVTINGDIDGDGEPDITFTSLSGTAVGVYVFSGGNTIHGLALQHLSYGVMIQRPSVAGQPPPNGVTLTNITVSNLVMTDIKDYGIWLFPGGPPSSSAVVTRSTWDHLLIVGNTLTGSVSSLRRAIALELINTAGDTLQHTTIANNKIVVPMPDARGIDIDIGYSIGSNNNQMLDTLIANNTIEGTQPQAAIWIGEGQNSASANLIDGMQMIANQIRITGPSQANLQASTSVIAIVNGDDTSDNLQPPVLPIQYSQNNIARNIGILANTIVGTGSMGIVVQAACCGNRNNSVDHLSILGNSIDVMQRGVFLVGGASGGAYSRPTTGNTLSNVLVQANTIKVTPVRQQPCNCYDFADGPTGITFGGVQIWAGWLEPGNSIDGISIANNDVDTPLVGIDVIGGFGGGGEPNAPPSPADNNVILALQIYCNQPEQAPTIGLGVQFHAGIKGINVTGGLLAAKGNQVQQVSVYDNLIAGVLGDASLFANLAGASGNTISIAKISTGVNGPQFGTAGLVNAARFEQRALAPGSLVSMFGLNLTGATVQFDGILAPIVFASASQLNLQVPWELQGKSNASVTVTVNGVTSAAQTVALAAADPGLFSSSGGQGAIVNLAGSLVDARSPAHAGDYLQIYATGLGAVTSTPRTGAQAVANPLSTLIGDRAVTIGGVQAPVSFAGLAPGFVGLFQVNVQVPAGVAAGDAVPVVLSVGGPVSNTVSIAVR